MNDSIGLPFLECLIIYYLSSIHTNKTQSQSQRLKSINTNTKKLTTVHIIILSDH